MRPARVRRLEASMHALLIDHGFMRDEPKSRAVAPGVSVTYTHRGRPAAAVLEGTADQRWPVSASVFSGTLSVRVGTADRPEHLRALLERSFP